MTTAREMGFTEPWQAGMNREGIFGTEERRAFETCKLREHPGIEAAEVEPLADILVSIHLDGMACFFVQRFHSYLHNETPKDDTDLERDLEGLRGRLAKYLRESELGEQRPDPELEQEVARAEAALQAVQRRVREIRKSRRESLAHWFTKIPTVRIKPGSPKRPELWHVNNGALRLYDYLAPRREEWSKSKLYELIYDLVESWLPPLLKDEDKAARAGAMGKRLERAKARAAKKEQRTTMVNYLELNAETGERREGKVQF